MCVLGYLSRLLLGLSCKSSRKNVKEKIVCVCVRTGDQTQDPSIHDAGNCSLFFREIESRYGEALGAMSGTYCFIHALCQPCLPQRPPHAPRYRGTEIGMCLMLRVRGALRRSGSQGTHTRVGFFFRWVIYKCGTAGMAVIAGRAGYGAKSTTSMPRARVSSNAALVPASRGRCHPLAC